MKAGTRYRLALALTWLLILAYGVYFSAYSIQWHRAFLTHASDLGQIDQAIWNTLHGRLLADTKPGGLQGNRLSDHVEPIFVPLSLVFLLYDNVETLLVVQSFAIAIGGLAVFWIARARLAPAATVGNAGDSQANAGWVDFAAVGFVALYLLFPALEAANLAEFHAVTLAPALLLFAYHYGSQRAWGRFLLFSLLALAVKEEISLLVLMLGFWFWVQPVIEGRTTNDLRALLRDRAWLAATVRSLLSHRRVALFVMALSIVWFVFAYGVIVPHFNALGKSPYTCRYLAGEDCGPVARGLYLPERLGYLGGLLASAGWIALLDPLALFLGLPLLAANVLSNYPGQYSGTYHYSAPVAPYLVLAAIGGSARLIGWLRQRREINKARPDRAPASGESRSGLRGVAAAWVLLPVFALALGYHLMAGYTPVAAAFSWPEVTPHDALFDRLAREVPADAVLSTTSALNPHVSHRPVIYRYPLVNDAEYVLLDVSESFATNPNDFRAAYDKIVADMHFGVVDAADGYILLKRGVASTALPDDFNTLFRAGDPRPQFAVTVDFGDRIRLMGYDVFNDPYGRGGLRLYWQALKPLDRDYTLFPFYPDANNIPRGDVTVPLTVMRWYPTSAWRPGETVVSQMVPLELGPRARVGVGVFAGPDWSRPEEILRARPLDASSAYIRGDASWVELGTLVQRNGRYVMERGGE